MLTCLLLLAGLSVAHASDTTTLCTEDVGGILASGSIAQTANASVPRLPISCDLRPCLPALLTLARDASRGAIRTPAAARQLQATVDVDAGLGAAAGAVNGSDSGGGSPTPGLLVVGAAELPLLPLLQAATAGNVTELAAIESVLDEDSPLPPSLLAPPPGFPGGPPAAPLLLLYRRDWWPAAASVSGRVNSSAAPASAPELPGTWQELAAVAAALVGRDLDGDGAPDHPLCLDLMPGCKGWSLLAAVWASLAQTEGSTQGFWLAANDTAGASRLEAPDPGPLASALRLYTALASANAAPFTPGGEAVSRSRLSTPLAELLAAGGAVTNASAPEPLCGAVNPLFAAGRCLFTVDWAHAVLRLTTAGAPAVSGRLGAALLPAGVPPSPSPVAPSRAPFVGAASDAWLLTDPHTDLLRLARVDEFTRLAGLELALKPSLLLGGRPVLPSTAGFGPRAPGNGTGAEAGALPLVLLAPRLDPDAGPDALAGMQLQLGPAAANGSLLGLHPADAAAVVKASASALAHPNRAYDIALPGGGSYRAVLDRAALAALRAVAEAGASAATAPGPGEPPLGGVAAEAVARAAATEMGTLAAAFPYASLLLHLYLASLGVEHAPYPAPSAPPAEPAEVDGPSAPAAMELTIGLTLGLGVVPAVVLMWVGWRQWRRRQLARKRGWGWDPPGAGPGTTLALTDVQNSTLLWELLAAAVMDRCLSIHHGVIREAISSHRGTECFTEGDAFAVAFHTPEDALGFALAVQSGLLDADWPTELLQTEDGGEVWARRRPPPGPHGALLLHPATEAPGAALAVTPTLGPARLGSAVHALPGGEPDPDRPSGRSSAPTRTSRTSRTSRASQVTVWPPSRPSPASEAHAPLGSDGGAHGRSPCGGVALHRTGRHGLLGSSGAPCRGARRPSTTLGLGLGSPVSPTSGPLAERSRHASGPEAGSGGVASHRSLRILLASGHNGALRSEAALDGPAGRSFSRSCSQLSPQGPIPGPGPAVPVRPAEMVLSPGRRLSRMGSSVARRMRGGGGVEAGSGGSGAGSPLYGNLPPAVEASNGEGVSLPPARCSLGGGSVGVLASGVAASPRSALGRLLTPPARASRMLGVSGAAEGGRQGLSLLVESGCDGEGPTVTGDAVLESAAVIATPAAAPGSPALGADLYTLGALGASSDGGASAREGPRGGRCGEPQPCAGPPPASPRLDVVGASTSHLRAPLATHAQRRATTEGVAGLRPSLLGTREGGTTAAQRPPPVTEQPECALEPEPAGPQPGPLGGAGLAHPVLASASPASPFLRAHIVGMYGMYGDGTKARGAAERRARRASDGYLHNLGGSWGFTAAPAAAAPSMADGDRTSLPSAQTVWAAQQHPQPHNGRGSTGYWEGAGAGVGLGNTGVHGPMLSGSAGTRLTASGGRPRAAFMLVPSAGRVDSMGMLSDGLAAAMDEVFLEEDAWQGLVPWDTTGLDRRPSLEDSDGVPTHRPRRPHRPPSGPGSHPPGSAAPAPKPSAPKDKDKEKDREKDKMVIRRSSTLVAALTGSSLLQPLRRLNRSDRPIQGAPPAASSAARATAPRSQAVEEADEYGIPNHGADLEAPRAGRQRTSNGTRQGGGGVRPGSGVVSSRWSVRLLGLGWASRRHSSTEIPSPGRERDPLSGAVSVSLAALARAAVGDRSVGRRHTDRSGALQDDRSFGRAAPAPALEGPFAGKHRLGDGATQGSSAGVYQAHSESPEEAVEAEQDRISPAGPAAASAAADEAAGPGLPSQPASLNTTPLPTIAIAHAPARGPAPARAPPQAQPQAQAVAMRPSGTEEPSSHGRPSWGRGLRWLLSPLHAAHLASFRGSMPALAGPEPLLSAGSGRRPTSSATAGASPALGRPSFGGAGPSFAPAPSAHAHGHRQSVFDALWMDVNAAAAAGADWAAAGIGMAPGPDIGGSPGPSPGPGLEAGPSPAVAMPALGLHSPSVVWLRGATRSLGLQLAALFERLGAEEAVALMRRGGPGKGAEEGRASPRDGGGGPGQDGEPFCIFRGLRVRAGLHSGPQAHEVTRARSEGGTVSPRAAGGGGGAGVSFRGEFLAVAKEVGDCAMGGVVVLSGACFRALQQRLRSGKPHRGCPRDTLLLHLGEHVLKQAPDLQGASEPPAREVYTAVSPALLPRLALLPSPLRSVREAVPGCLGAATGLVTPVFCSVLGVEALLAWERVARGRRLHAAHEHHSQHNLYAHPSLLLKASPSLARNVHRASMDTPHAWELGEGGGAGGWNEAATPGVVRQALSLFGGIAQRLAACHGGYVVASSADGGHWVLVFGAPERAVAWGLDMVDAMLAADWPPGFLEHELTEEEWEGPVLVRRGMRLRIGIDYGLAMVRLVPRTGRLDYTGRPMNRAARICAKAKAEGVMVSGAAWEAAGPFLCEPRLVACCLGEALLKGVRGPIELWQLQRERGAVEQEEEARSQNGNMGS